jgi:hypothetical protein
MRSATLQSAMPEKYIIWTLNCETGYERGIDSAVEKHEQRARKSKGLFNSRMIECDYTMLSLFAVEVGFRKPKDKCMLKAGK